MTRLAGWSQRHHWTAIALWLVALVAITIGSTIAGNDYRNDFSLPGTESQELVAMQRPDVRSTKVRIWFMPRIAMRLRGVSGLRPK